MEAGHAIVGTAGHVDHGKTALIRALTGVNTDRLPEEQARGISIELGFAPLRLPSGRRVGVVDVPGHERFVHHMVAGAAGMDVVILVVAADEGVMPQTREHLDVLSLLGLQRGLVAITKVDLVDPEWLSLVEEEVRASLRGTFLEAAPLVPVSSETGQGLDELVRVLDHILAEVPGRDASGPARLPVDRVFSVTGFGTVVTGTLVSGTLAVGDSVEILPIGPGAGRQVRIRQLQVHGEKVERAAAGQRVAVNLVGVERQQIERGQVLCQPRAFSATRRLAGRLHLLPSAPVFVSGTRVHLHLGTAEVGARVALLDREELSPGQDSLVRIGLEAEVVAARGDRFVIRSWSPPHTVGGGVVIAPHSQHRRYLAAHLKSLQRLERGGPQAEIMDLLDGREPLWTVAQLSARAGLEVDRGKEILGRLQEEGRVVELGGEWWGSRDRLARLCEKALAALNDYHRRFPARRGMPREELRQYLAVPDARAFTALLQHWEREGQVVVGAAERVGLPAFRAGGQGELARVRERVLDILEKGNFSPPTRGELGQEFSGPVDDLLEALAEEGELVRISPDLYLRRSAYAETEKRVREFLQQHGHMTAAEFRDLLGTTRKYAIPLLEYLDRTHVTRRVGDVRVLHAGGKER